MESKKDEILMLNVICLENEARRNPDLPSSENRGVLECIQERPRGY